MNYRSVVKGLGTYTPQKVVTNFDLEQQFDTTDEWIRSRTGIQQRFHAAEGEYTSDLGVAAAKKCLHAAGISPMDIDAIIVATCTPDNTFPATAVTIQRKLGAHRAFAFDVSAVCSGFVYALAVANNFITSGQLKNVLVIGAETMSRILNPEDRATSVLFGDGAGALLLTQDNDETSQGILSTHLFSDGQFEDLLTTKVGPSKGQTVGFISMLGREVMRHAINKIGQAVNVALEHNNLSIQDIDWFVPHQANLRIIEGLNEHFKLPKEKTIVSIHKHANTSAASIPLALQYAIEEGKIKKNDLILIEAMGAGLTWGSAILRW